MMLRLVDHYDTPVIGPSASPASHACHASTTVSADAQRMGGYILRD